jgi:hypothetical protein
MPHPRPAAKLGWIVIPLAIAPLVLAAWPMDGTWFFIVAAAICFAAPAAGFWWGEMKGKTGASKAALGCAGTVVLFGFYLLWAVAIARLLFG